MGQYPNPFQIHLLKLNPVPLGAGWIPEKTRPIVILKLDHLFEDFSLKGHGVLATFKVCIRHLTIF